MRDFVKFIGASLRAAVTGRREYYAWLAFLLLPSPEVPNPVWVAIRAGACGVLGMSIHIASARFRRAAEARRRGRMSRLRLG